MAKPLALSLVIPAYNEARRLPRTLAALARALAARPERCEVIVVDDGSHDGTADVVRAARLPGLRLISYQPNRGKGYAVRTGMLSASGAIVGFMDADLSTDLAAIDTALREIAAGWDIVIGSRALPGAQIIVPQPRYRVVATRIFNLLQVAMSGVRGYADTQCGFKMMTAAAARDIFRRARIDGFMFDIELLFLAERLGYRVREVPVTWTNDPASRLRIVRDTARMFRDLARIRWAGRTLRPRRRHSAMATMRKPPASPSRRAVGTLSSPASQRDQGRG
ncbi:MAG: glycosyltransferase family 2 protein [Chloroflexota bacterium]|nr:glycosyltransferase family 2 protein [Dehalococcoidia bacterium]MDW8254403.1 glycosyltransferase family 2 protein [Chloroflexota bacterium]